MRPYIKNLTDNLIGKHRFDDAFKRESDRDEFLRQVQFDLENIDVNDMKPETLGKIMCSFEVGDVMAAKEHLAQGIHFAGDCGEMLRELVALCLAYAIRERLEESEYEHGSPVPPYRRTAKN
ncbi:MAG: hypothetical protein HYS44_01315 [Candidatus Niyogibacteria bacterium]|nr:hypothetical protein [Candidatus Niyogibacteria bacterium]